LDKFERFFLYEIAPEYLRHNKYWQAFLKIRTLRGIGCNFSLRVCEKLVEENAELANQILNEEIKRTK